MTTTDPTPAEQEAWENTQALEQHRQALRLAQDAANFWGDLAGELTHLREVGGQHLPATDTEEWFEPRRPQIPFDLEQLDAELMALSGLITKAYTLTAIYEQNAVYLDEIITAAEADR